jgi:hypothetical protein
VRRGVPPSVGCPSAAAPPFLCCCWPGPDSFLPRSLRPPAVPQNRGELHHPCQERVLRRHHLPQASRLLQQLQMPGRVGAALQCRCLPVLLARGTKTRRARLLLSCLQSALLKSVACSAAAAPQSHQGLHAADGRPPWCALSAQPHPRSAPVACAQLFVGFRVCIIQGLPSPGRMRPPLGALAAGCGGGRAARLTQPGCPAQGRAGAASRTRRYAC